MSADLVYRWYVSGGVLIRRNNPVQPPSQFVAFLPGTVKPVGARDTGTRNIGHRIPLTRYDGNVTVSSAQTVSGLDIFGGVTFTGAGILRDCRVRGPVAASGVPGPFPNRTADPFTSTKSIVTGTGADLRGSLIEWCTLDATGYESAWMDGIRSGNYTMRYCEITRGVDSGGMNTIGNATLYCCRLSNGYYTAHRHASTGLNYTGFPTSPSDLTCHSDGCQIQSATGWTIQGCYIGGGPGSGIDGATAQANRDPGIPSQLAVIQACDASPDYRNSCIILNTVSPTTSPVGALIEKNWFQGGSATINVSAVAADTFLVTGNKGVTIRNNRFVKPSSGYQIYENVNSQATITGNVFDDGSGAVTIVPWGTLGV